MIEIFENQILIAALLAWGIAQTIKVPMEYLATKRWNWALLFQSGGMPSSHSALVTAVSHAIGLYEGFNTGLFALAFTLSMVVIYDATGIRRQAGRHAEIINAMISDLATGHPLKQELLREVLGHTPVQAFWGIILGLVTAQAMFWLWP
jgi:uncharacterized protein